MYKLYEVQTFYGTRRKIFQWRHNAEAYYQKLCEECECVDPIYSWNATLEEYVMENIED